jgi:DNA polymerase III alpha subunit (gram-positive type)
MPANTITRRALRVSGENKDKRGYFKYILAMDSETTGLYFNGDNPSVNESTGKHHQAISWGFIVANADTLEAVDKLYIEIKWDGKSDWNAGAEAVHGLSKEHLEQNGVSEEDAMVEIANLILKYWGTTPVVTLGHNVVTFDLPFLKTAMRRHDIELNFGNRHVDTNGAGFLTFGTYNSDDLFSEAGMPERKQHNAMEDIEFTLESARRIKLLFNSVFE